MSKFCQEIVKIRLSCLGSLRVPWSVIKRTVELRGTTSPCFIKTDKDIAAMNGKDMKSRNMTVNEARPRTDRPRTGGGGRGGFGGGTGSRRYSVACLTLSQA